MPSHRQNAACRRRAASLSLHPVSSSVLRSARLISILTLASRVLGLLRDIAITNAFGVGSISSAFWTAFQVPNLFRRLFGEGALSAASIPVLSETLSLQGRETVDALAGRLLGILLAILTALCVIAEVIVAVLFLRYRGSEDSSLALRLTALMLPYMIFICTAAILGGIQNVLNRFASAAAAPIILNVFMIGAAIGGRWITPSLERQVIILAAAVVVSGMLQMTWQWAAARRCGLRLPIRFDTGEPAIRRIGVTMLPMIVGLATVQFSTFMDTLIAWWFVPDVYAHGSSGAEKVGPAILSLAQRLYQFPLGIFATALATAIFPALSRHAAEKDLDGLGRTLTRGIGVATFEAFPCLVGLILVREPLIRTFFAHGEFLRIPGAVDRVSFALFMYALGIWAFGLNQIVVRAFYAMKDARTPMRMSIATVLVNLALNLVLVRTPLREAGLALSSSITSSLQIAALMLLFDRRYVRLAWHEMVPGILRTLAAALIMGLVVYVVDHNLPAARSVTRLAILIAVGAASYFAAAWMLRCRELRDMLHR